MGDRNIAISIDLKKYRIRIHRNTLGLLGTPNYVQLLIHPEKMILAIRGVGEKAPETHRVNLSRLQPDNSFELYSKSLIEEMKSIVHGLDDGFAYRLEGKALPEQKIAVFSLSTMRRID